MSILQKKTINMLKMYGILLDISLADVFKNFRVA